MLVDISRLAYEAFQGCRHALVGSPDLLALLTSTLVEAREKKLLALEVPESRIDALAPQARRMVTPALRSEPPDHRQLTESDEWLLDLCQVAAVELKRLWEVMALGPIRNLGYAMHPVPGCIGSNGRFNRGNFVFNFQVAAYHWSALSVEMRRALADAVGISLERADTLVRSKGFAVEMYPEWMSGYVADLKAPE